MLKPVILNLRFALFLRDLRGDHEGFSHLSKVKTKKNNLLNKCWTALASPCM